MSLLIRNARLKDGEAPKDVLIEKGKIARVESAIAPEGRGCVDAAGRVLIPGLVESHLHLEKALVKDRRPNRSGTLREAIAVTAELKPTFTAEDIDARARKVLGWLVANGTTHLRAHAEFDPQQGYTGLEATLALKREFRNLIDIQVCAFPQEGIEKAPGTEAMLRRALEMGADVCGAIPYNDLDASRHIDLVFRIAREYGKPLDFHQDFSDNADNMSIEYVIERTVAHGYEGRVSVGHLTALGAVPPERARDIARRLAGAGISVMCLPATDLHLGGRADQYNVRRTLTPVRLLRDAGVNVCLGTNNIRNAFTPYNNGDILETALLAVAACHLGGQDDLATVLPMLTANPARALGLEGYGIFPGARADLVLLDTESVADAVIDQPDRLYVIKDGNIVARTRREVEIASPGGPGLAVQC